MKNLKKNVSLGMSILISVLSIGSQPARSLPIKPSEPLKEYYYGVPYSYGYTEANSLLVELYGTSVRYSPGNKLQAENEWRAQVKVARPDFYPNFESGIKGPFTSLQEANYFKLCSKAQSLSSVAEIPFNYHERGDDNSSNENNTVSKNTGNQSNNTNSFSNQHTGAVTAQTNVTSNGNSGGTGPMSDMAKQAAASDCERSSKYLEYHRLAEAGNMSASYCAAVVLLQCYIDHGLYGGNTGLTLQQLENIIIQNRDLAKSYNNHEVDDYPKLPDRNQSNNSSTSTSQSTSDEKPMAVYYYNSYSDGETSILIATLPERIVSDPNSTFAFAPDEIKSKHWNAIESYIQRNYSGAHTFFAAYQCEHVQSKSTEAQLSAIKDDMIQSLDKFRTGDPNKDSYRICQAIIIDPSTLNMVFQRSSNRPPKRSGGGYFGPR